MMTPKDKVLHWINKQCENEKGKWECGMKNEYFQWEEIRETIESALGGKKWNN